MPSAPPEPSPASNGADDEAPLPASQTKAAAATPSTSAAKGTPDEAPSTSAAKGAPDEAPSASAAKGTPDEAPSASAAKDAPDEAPSAKGAGFQVRAYPPALRGLAVFLQALAALNVAYVGANVIFDLLEGTRRAPALLVALALAAFSGGPWALNALLRRLRKARLDLGATHLTLTLRAARIEIPLASIKALRPFALPLPAPGLALELGSGRRFRHRLLLDAPGALLAALAERLPPARDALAKPPVAFADAQHERSRRPWYFGALKWGAYPLALTVIVFRLNQFIMYGGPFGQYQMYGLGPYLKSFLNYWASTAGGLVLYAAIVRAAAEMLAFALTWLAPARARLVRSGAEIVCQGAYFVLVPAFVALRLLL